MKNQIKLFIFVITLGLITSLLLIGMDEFTKDRIALNELALLKGSILETNAISYNYTTVHDIFDEEIEVVEHTYEGETFTFYIHQTTGNISYQFEGGGIWGPIIGIITLNSDFDTIVAIRILQQEETPGLGGIVAEVRYLDTFVGKKIDPEILVRKDTSPNADNEVDAITGATGTSSRFELILNTNYQAHKAAWEDLNN